MEVKTIRESSASLSPADEVRLRQMNENFCPKEWFALMGELLRKLGNRGLLVVFIGIQGAGKGTQRRYLAQIGFHDIEVSAKLKQLPEEHPARKLMRQGKFVPDEIINNIIESEIQDNGFPVFVALDGAPRNGGQEALLKEFVDLHGYAVCAIHIHADEEVAYNRAKARDIAEGRDDAGALLKRIDQFKLETEPIIPSLEKFATAFLRVDNTNRDPEEVFFEIKGFLGVTATELIHRSI
ncbi:MAG: nucleoside monophosphate kinase [Candidatus Pacebacteria bacterium]|nr:nucleoside monophosphate kinase [Candidatus Paceibacterota bacterium]